MPVKALHRKGLGAAAGSDLADEFNCRPDGIGGAPAASIRHRRQAAPGAPAPGATPHLLSPSPRASPPTPQPHLAQRNGGSLGRAAGCSLRPRVRPLSEARGPRPGIVVGRPRLLPPQTPAPLVPQEAMTSSLQARADLHPSRPLRAPLQTPAPPRGGRPGSRFSRSRGARLMSRWRSRRQLPGTACPSPQAWHTPARPAPAGAPPS